MSTSYTYRVNTLNNAASKKDTVVRNWAYSQIRNDAARDASSDTSGCADTAVARAKLALAAHTSLSKRYR